MSGSILARTARWLIGRASVLLPEDLQPWAEALVAEAAVVPDDERPRFVWGAAIALARMTAVRSISGAWSERTPLLNAFMVGLAVALVDANSDTRNPLRVLSLASAALAGCFVPRHGWRAGVLIGLGPPLIATFDASGPYAYDRGDAWFVLPATTLVAAVAGWLSLRVARE